MKIIKTRLLALMLTLAMMANILMVDTMTIDVQAAEPGNSQKTVYVEGSKSDSWSSKYPASLYTRKYIDPTYKDVTTTTTKTVYTGQVKKTYVPAEYKYVSKYVPAKYKSVKDRYVPAVTKRVPYLIRSAYTKTTKVTTPAVYKNRKYVYKKGYYTSKKVYVAPKTTYKSVYVAKYKYVKKYTYKTIGGRRYYRSYYKKVRNGGSYVTKKYKTAGYYKTLKKYVSPVYKTKRIMVKPSTTRYVNTRVAAKYGTRTETIRKGYWKYKSVKVSNSKYTYEKKITKAAYYKEEKLTRKLTETSVKKVLVKAGKWKYTKKSISKDPEPDAADALSILSTSYGFVMHNGQYGAPILIKSSLRPNNIGIGTWIKTTTAYADEVANSAKVASKVGTKIFAVGAVLVTTGVGIQENIEKGTDTQRIVTDAVIDATYSVGSVAAGIAAGALIGSVIPVAGTAVGAVIGGVAVAAASVIGSIAFDAVTEKAKEEAKDALDDVVDFFGGLFN